MQDIMKARKKDTAVKPPARLDPHEGDFDLPPTLYLEGRVFERLEMKPSIAKNKHEEREKDEALLAGLWVAKLQPPVDALPGDPAHVASCGCDDATLRASNQRLPGTRGSWTI